MAGSPELHKEELQFRVTTPLYLGGADPTSGSDTRIYVRPIVAQWRWWFRALAGGVFGTSDEGLKRVRAEEQRVFGGVHKVGEAPTGAMQFRVRLVEQKLNGALLDFPQRDPVMNYLGYGLGRTGDRGARFGIPPGSQFKLEVIASEKTLQLIHILNYFWVNFGGLGARQRRGLGSIEWIHPKNPTPQNGRGAREKREEFKKLLDGSGEPGFGAIPEMPVVHAGWFRAKVAKASFSSWKDALKAIRNQLRIEAPGRPCSGEHLGSRGFGYRQGDGERHKWKEQTSGRGFAYYPTRDKQEARRIRQALQARKSCTVNPLKNPLFGLPLVFSGWNLRITAYQQQDSKEVEIRRPSPLSFRVFPTDRSYCKYGVIITYFKSRFIPENAHLRAVLARSGNCDVKHANWDYLDYFFDWCDGAEVAL